MLASEAIVGPSHTELVQHVVQCALNMTVYYGAPNQSRLQGCRGSINEHT